jgi:hypothetical protein
MIAYQKYNPARQAVSMRSCPALKMMDKQCAHLRSIDCVRTTHTSDSAEEHLVHRGVQAGWVTQEATVV